MADRAVFESPVVKLRPTTGNEGLELVDLSSTPKWVVRGSADSLAAETLGVGFGSSRTIAGVLVLGSRPQEWLLLGPVAELGNLVAGIDRCGFVSIIDLTHGRALFRLTGRSAIPALEKVCSLDWSDEMTPNGAVASASVAKVTCDLARNDRAGAASFLIACDRSFGQYLFDALIDAAGEFGLGTVSADQS